MQNEHVDDQLRQHDHRSEGDVVLQIIVSDLVILSNLSLVGEKVDEDQTEGDHEEGLRLTCI